VRVSFEGKCTIERAAELRERLLKALNAGESVDIDFQGVSDMDLSFCQLIHALRVSCEGRGLSCALAADLPPQLAALAVKCGLPELVRPSAGDAVTGKEDAR